MNEELVKVFEKYIRGQKPAWVPALRDVLSIEKKEGELTVSVAATFGGRRLSSRDGLEIFKKVFKVMAVRVDVIDLKSPGLKEKN